MALGRGEYPKLSTPLELFPRGLKPEGNNPSGVDNFRYSPIQRAVVTYSFFPHTHFSPRKNEYILSFPPGKMSIY